MKITDDRHALYTTDEATRISPDGRPKLTIDIILTRHVHIINQMVHDDMDSGYRPVSFEVRSVQVNINPWQRTGRATKDL